MCIKQHAYSKLYSISFDLIAAATMPNTNKHRLKFSINNWQHLYSLKDAISKSNEESGKSLTVTGTIRNDSLLQNHDTQIEIHFKQAPQFPDYDSTDEGELILGYLNKSNQGLNTVLDINESVFEEMKKNLIEYADIDGIHIVMSCDVITEHDHWQDNTALKIISLDYAMRGDA